MSDVVAPWPSQFKPALVSMSDKTMKGIATEVAERHGLSLAQLHARVHERRIAWPRQEAMWEIYQTGRFSLGRIGMYFGGRDHTTVLHGVREHQRRLDAQPPQVTLPAE